MGKHFPLLKHSREISNFLKGSFFFFLLLLLFPTENYIIETDLNATSLLLTTSECNSGHFDSFTHYTST